MFDVQGRDGIQAPGNNKIKKQSEEGLAARLGTNNFKTSSPRSSALEDPESQPGNNNVD